MATIALRVVTLVYLLAQIGGDQREDLAKKRKAPMPGSTLNLHAYHIAAAVVAVFFTGWLVLNLFSLMFRHSGRTPGCVSTIVVAIIALVAIILALKL